MMKRSLLPLLTIALTGFICSSSPKPVLADNYEAPGNLQSTAPLGCVPLANVTNRYTPADIYPGVAKCITIGDYDRAAALFALAGVYGDFDMQRVSDATALDALQVLRLNDFGNLPKEKYEAFQKAVPAYAQQDSRKHAALCLSIKRIGSPNYFPTYMVQHGMKAFLGGEGNGLKANFDAKTAWQQALSRYLECRY